MKLKIKTLNNIMEKATNKEIDFIMYIAQFQNAFGIVENVTYKDVIKAISINKSTFFKLIRGLENKEIIEVDYVNKEIDKWKITILNNVFLSARDMKEGYLNLNYDILHSVNFITKYTKTEKILTVNFLKMYQGIKEDIPLTWKKLKEWTGKGKRDLMKFLKNLEMTFGLDLERNERLIYINTLKNVRVTGFQKRTSPEEDIKIIHELKTGAKDRKISNDDIPCNMKDVLIMFKQYAKVGRDAIIKIFFEIYERCGRVDSKYMNKVLQAQTKWRKTISI